MVYAQTNPLSLTKGRLLEREKELAYQCMPAILPSLFLLPILFSFLFCYFYSFPLFSFLMLTHVVLWRCCNLLLMVATVAMILLCTARALYILLAVTGFYYFAF